MSEYKLVDPIYVRVFLSIAAKFKILPMQCIYKNTRTNDQQNMLTGTTYFRHEALFIRSRKMCLLAPVCRRNARGEYFLLFFFSYRNFVRTSALKTTYNLHAHSHQEAIQNKSRD